MNTLAVFPSARSLSRAFFHPLVLSFCAALLFGGCATSKDAKSRGNIESLKASHLAYIDEFTERDGQTWDDERLTIQTADLEEKFAEVEKYEATKKKDARRSAAIANLRAQFKRNAAMLQRRKAFYRATFAAEMKGQITQNYDQALRGEDVRP